MNCNEEAAMLRSIRTSIATVSISGTLPEKLRAIKAAGFDGVEIFENDLLYFDGTPAACAPISASRSTCFSRSAISTA
jgi:sugar phosphate isomerase/epimerase